MNIEKLSKDIGGVAHIFGGIFVAVAYSLHPHHQTPEIIAGQFWLFIHILFALSLIFGIFGLIGLFQQHLKKSRLGGLIGFLLAVTSLTGIFGLNYFEAFINLVLAQQAPGFVSEYGAGTTIGLVKILFPMAGAMFLLGYVLLCVDMLRAKTLNRPVVVLTIAGTLVFGFGLSGFFPMIVVKVGSVLFGCGLIGLGIAVIRLQAPTK
jgi:hypothetical protein